MKRHDLHIPAEDLLRFSDGELPLFRTVAVKKHLAQCRDCRAKLQRSEQTIRDFVRSYRCTLDPQLPPAAGTRALLKARLQQIEPATGSAAQWTITRWSLVAAAGLFCALVAGAVLLTSRWVVSRQSASTPQNLSYVEPNPRFTPGATRPVSTGELCTAEYSDDASLVSAEVKQRVLKEYGLSGERRTDYQLDYLISPQLGGTEDASNVWPEPSATTVWNARTKDELEQKLHQMVCRGNISLATAQQDLARDWVSAYKKYVQTTQPLRPL
jgi:hypothetical protein